MGSFNTTCAVSKAPIRRGQKARVFFLIMNTFEHHYNLSQKGLFSSILQGFQCYPWDSFKVIGYPLVGSYQDYNQYEFEDKYLEDLTLSIINKFYIPNTIQEGKTEKDYNTYHDHLNIDQISDMKQLQDMEHSGALRVKSPHGVSIIAKMAIHEEVFQQLIKTSIFEFNHIEYGLNYSHEQYSKYLLDILNNKEQLIKNSTETDPLFLDFLIKDKLNEFFRHEGLLQNYPNLILSCQDEDNKEKLLQSHVDFIWTAKFFQKYSFDFLPAFSSGQDIPDHSNMLKSLSHIVENLKSDYDDEETITLHKEVSEKISISLAELDEKFNSWYNDEENLTNYANFVNEIKNNGIEFINLEEKNKITEFLFDYNIVKIDTGIIYFKP